MTDVIDTLYLSPLLFPTKPYHKLLKDDKLQTDELNNPLNDSIKAKDLFHDEVAAFTQADPALKQYLGFWVCGVGQQPAANPAYEPLTNQVRTIMRACPSYLPWFRDNLLK